MNDSTLSLCRHFVLIWDVKYSMNYSCILKIFISPYTVVATCHNMATNLTKLSSTAPFEETALKT